jgi:hypothetical protein
MVQKFKTVRRTLGKVQLFLRRHKWVWPVVIISIVVLPIAVHKHGTLWGQDVVVYKLGDIVTLDRPPFRSAPRGKNDYGGGIDWEVQGMLDRARQREAIADAIRKGAMAAAP